MSDAPQKPTLKKRLAAGGVFALLVTSTVGGFEGVRQSAYPDPATRGAPWTDCYGHTGPDVAPGVRQSLGQCKVLLRGDLGRDAEKLDHCLTREPSDGQAVAFLSLAYNIGPYGFCRSSVARDFNAGHLIKACDDLLRYDHAAGVTFPGLKRRREKERALCLSH
ncbi:lysozyme [Rhodoblastus sp.]|uniref:lysozyme n=1 Tax=Rhodoblastus sp. TaxID=1962975 RepID=UPI003F9D6F07